MLNPHQITIKRAQNELELSRPENLHQDIWEFVQRCMAFEPRKRISSEKALQEMKEFVDKGIDVAPDFSG